MQGAMRPYTLDLVATLSALASGNLTIRFPAAGHVNRSLAEPIRRLIHAKECTSAWIRGPQQVGLADATRRRFTVLAIAW